MSTRDFRSFDNSTDFYRHLFGLPETPAPRRVATPASKAAPILAPIITAPRPATVERAVLELSTKSSEADGERILEGWASTGDVDRIGDVVEPRGAKFTLPLPFLWQHRHAEPIGHVEHANVTDKGIYIRANISKANVPAVTHAWESIKAGLVRGLSIGFRSIGDPEKMPNGGKRFKEFELLEISVVTIPANSAAAFSIAKRDMVQQHVKVLTT